MLGPLLFYSLISKSLKPQKYKESDNGHNVLSESLNRFLFSVQANTCLLVPQPKKKKKKKKEQMKKFVVFT